MTTGPMRRALELAWEAFCAGSFPVGAVITDAAGAIVAEGRNRIGEGDAPPGRLRNTALAHAEMDAFAQLPLGDYTTHVLYSSLEPCLLCRSAATMTGIGTVHYLAGDALCEGLDQLPTINAHASRRYPTMHGPGQGTHARFASVLPLAVLFLFNREAAATTHYVEYSADDVVAARRIVDEHLWPRRTLDLDGAIAALTPLFD